MRRFTSIISIRRDSRKRGKRGGFLRIIRALQSHLSRAAVITFAVIGSTGAFAHGADGVRLEKQTPDQAAQSKIPAELREAGITEHLGDSVAIGSLKFADESGAIVPLSTYFASGKPVLLNFVYYECPNLCSMVLNGLVDSLKKLDWIPGKQFEIVTLSINPREKPDLASKKRESYLKVYGRPEGAAGWHFLTGSEDQIQALAKQTGFGYRWDPIDQQYAHSAALIVLTPEGKISRYLYGIQYAVKDLKLALLEASSGQIGTVIDRLVMFCFHYNPNTRSYSVYVFRLMQVACVVTAAALAFGLLVFWRRERLQPRESNAHV